MLPPSMFTIHISFFWKTESAISEICSNKQEKEMCVVLWYVENSETDVTNKIRYPYSVVPILSS